ncbi:MAG TPA: hypothetical protein VGN18_08610 [Jatrophihabitans sp.]|jgi:hypothetical protein|uniref:hypothetical protein n=1 Tax=Jatrophihabitans sp. TaxID=1932789 RepID=UPI002DFBB8CB|nr:hypothetical protein [Jatrophihabitans sp.]
MILTSRHRPRHRALRDPLSRMGLLLALGALVTGLLVAPGARTASASSAHAIRAGLGYRLAGGDFVGYYSSGGRLIYCVRPTKAAPYAVTLATVGLVPGTNRTQTAELAYALSRWGDARTAFQAAVESQVLNTLVGNGPAVARRAVHLPRSVTARVAEHVRAARALHGPYSVEVTAPRALLPGQSAVGSVRVRTGAGRYLVGALVALRPSANAQAPRAVRTDGRGVARFRYAVTGTGEVRLRATAPGLPGLTVRTSRPRSSEQLMVSSGTTASASGATGFRQTVNGFSHRYSCTSTCDGRPRTELAACAAAGRYPSRIEFRVGRRLTLTLTFGASAVRVCRSVASTLRDGERVTASWRFLTPHGLTGPTAAAGSFVVDCPPVPAVAVSVVFDCATASVTIALAHRSSSTSGWIPLVNRTRHRMQLIIGGAVTRRVTAAPGHSAVFSATARCDTPVRYTAQAAVERADHGYNEGPVASITTPARAAA